MLSISAAEESHGDRMIGGTEHSRDSSSCRSTLVLLFAQLWSALETVARPLMPIIRTYRSALPFPPLILLTREFVLNHETHTCSSSCSQISSNPSICSSCSSPDSAKYFGRSVTKRVLASREGSLGKASSDRMKLRRCTSQHHILELTGSAALEL